MTCPFGRTIRSVGTAVTENFWARAGFSTALILTMTKFALTWAAIWGWVKTSFPICCADTLSFPKKWKKRGRCSRSARAVAAFKSVSHRTVCNGGRVARPDTVKKQTETRAVKTGKPRQYFNGGLFIVFCTTRYYPVMQNISSESLCLPTSTNSDRTV